MSLAAVLTKLASTPANGGASVTFATGSVGSATVSISPQEELTVSVQDCSWGGIRFDLQVARVCLDYLDPSQRDTWIRVG